MAISLKQQLSQVTQINEVSYHAPIFDKNYYDGAHGTQHAVGRKAGKRMFHDFYAMEFLWSFLGSGQIPKAEREKLIGLDLDDPKRDIITNKAHRFLPAQAVKTIDSVYEQVTNAVAKNLLAYIRLAVIQEFQYLTSQSDGWKDFRYALMKEYNKNGKISKTRFNELVKDNIPNMAPYPETIKRLLKFSKYYSSMGSSLDPYNATRTLDRDPKSSEEPTSEPEQPTPPEEPDTTDYNVPPTSREFGKYGGKDQPTSPYEPETPWSGMSAFNDAGDLPSIPSDDDDDDENPSQSLTEQLLTEEDINTDKIRDVYAAINKSGVTLDDIEKAYNNIPWGGLYGGNRWGAGVIALLKLVNAKKKLSTEDMNHIIDHIYDLQHNTGSLLNKGPMYVSETDLNRRYKISDVMRFVPFVSPLVRDLILRYQRYLRVDPAQAEREANMVNILNAPKVPLNPEEKQQLVGLGFQAIGDNSWRVAIRFKNKQDNEVAGMYYQISKNETGSAEKSAPLYVVQDNLLADVKAFDTFEEAKKYLETHKKDMISGGFVGTPASSHGMSPSPVVSAKQTYLDSHKRIKLPPDKEQRLLDINLGWRSKPSSLYYKAYFTSGNRFNFYAFSDGTFLLGHQNSYDFKTFTDFESAYAYAKEQTKDAQEYPEKAKNQAEINAALGKPSLAAVPAPASTQGTTPTLKSALEFTLSSEQIQALQGIIQNLTHGPNESYVLLYSNKGLPVVYKKKFHVEKPLFGIGQTLSSGFIKPYKIVKYDGNTSAPGLTWTFDTWANAISFIETNIDILVGSTKGSVQGTTITPSTYVSPSGKQLPPHATSKVAYKVHSGLSTLPKSTIRLTKEDEDKLISIGFEPRVVGNDVWYIHKASGDSVKFFPNNIAKLLFTSQGTKVPAINKDIDAMLAFLPTKYTSSTMASPIKTGASVPTSSPDPSQPVVNKGIKAGTMFEKDISTAGFVWDASQNRYVDGQNELRIAPDRSSVLKYKVDTDAYHSRSFKDLISLITFLKNEYPQKKSNVTSAAVSPLSSIKGLTPEQSELLDKAGFVHEGPVSNGGQVVKNETGGHIVVYPTGDVKVFDFAKDDWDVYTGENFTTYLKQKYGNVGNAQPHTDPNILSKDEEDAIIDLVSKFGLQGQKKYEEPIKEAKQQMQYIEIWDDAGPTYAINKEFGTYRIWKVNPNEPTNTGQWGSVASVDTFDKLIYTLENLLEGYTGKSATNSKETTGIQALDNRLTHYGFKYAGPTTQSIRGKLKKGKVFDDYVHNRVIYFEDNSSMVFWNYKGTDHNFKDAASLISFLDKEGPKVTNDPHSTSYYNNVGPSPTVYSIRLKSTDEAKLKANGWEYIPTKATQTPLHYRNEALGNVKLIFFNKGISANKNKPNAELQSPEGKVIQDFFFEIPLVLDWVIEYAKKSHYNPDTGPVGNPISIWDTFHSDLDDAGFVETKDDKGRITYTHGPDFRFNVWPVAIQWRTPEGIKEVGVTQEGLMEFLNVIKQVTPEMSWKQISELFSYQAMSKKDKLFVSLLKEAQSKNGVGGNSGPGKKFDADMEEIGFFWDFTNKSYVNEEIYQIVVVQIVNNTYKYTVYYLSDIVGQHMLVSNEKLFLEIGPNGKIENLVKSKRTSPATKNAPAAPSSTYTLPENDKVFADLWEMAGKAPGVEVNDPTFSHEMNKEGFWFDLTNKFYYNKELKQIVVVSAKEKYVYTIFYVDKGGYPRSKVVTHNILFDEIGKDGYLASDVASTKSVTNPSGETYKKVSGMANVDLVKLNVHDEELMMKGGFKFVPHENRYYKDAMGNIFKFYSNGTAVEYAADGDYNEFSNIPSALEYFVKKYIGTNLKENVYKTIMKLMYQ